MTTFSLDEIRLKIRDGIFKTRNKLYEGQSKRYKSKIWTVCDEILDDAGNVVKYAIHCKKCDKVFKYDSKSVGTSTILYHGCLSDSNTQPRLDGFATTTKTIAAIDKTKVKEGAVSFVSKDLRPFEAISGIGLFNLIRICVFIGAKYGNLAEDEIRALLPSPHTVSRHVAQYAIMLKHSLYEKVRNVVRNTGAALTTDLWTDSFKRISYMVMTMHFIDANVLRDQILCLVPLSFTQKKTGDYLASVTRVQLEKIGLFEFSHKLVFVTDRGKNLINAFSLLNIDRLSCFDHLLNNTVQKVCIMPLVDQVLKPVRKLVKFIKISGNNNRFKKGLKSYVKTRWNTNYEMGQSVEENFEQLENVLSELREEERISVIDRLYLREIIDFLKVFKQISIELETSLKPSLYLVWPSSARILNYLSPSRVNSVLLKKMKKVARVYFNKNFVLNKLHRIATLLHPQMKSLKFASDELKLQTIRDLKELFSEIDLQMPNNQTLRRKSTDSVVSDYFDDDSDLDEVELYVAYKVSTSEEIDVLEWWSNHSQTFPKLYQIATFIHSIPATSAPSERKFSLAGNILNCLRTSLDPSKVEDLLLLHSNSDEFESRHIFNADLW